MSKGLIENKAGSMSSSDEVAALLQEMTADDFRKAYLDYVNNFLTIARFASYYGLTETQAETIISAGRLFQDTYANALKSLKG